MVAPRSGPRSRGFAWPVGHADATPPQSAEWHRGAANANGLDRSMTGMEIRMPENRMLVWR
jgi:hypothetical protein